MTFDRSRLFDNLQSDLVKVGEYGMFGYDPYSIKQVVESGKPISRGILSSIEDGKNPYVRNIGKKFPFFYRMTKEEFLAVVPHGSYLRKMQNDIR